MPPTALVHASEDANLLVRRWAVYCLGKVNARTEQSLPVLLRKLKDEDTAIRVYAAFALCESIPEEAANALQVLFARRSMEW